MNFAKTPILGKILARSRSIYDENFLLKCKVKIHQSGFGKVIIYHNKRDK
jgi:hypothetical protein